MRFVRKSKQLAVGYGVTIGLVCATGCALGRPASALASSLPAIMLLLWNLRLIHRIATTTNRIASMHGDNGKVLSLDDGVAQVEQQLLSLRHRLQSTHPVSRLPMREALIAQMSVTGIGQLGALALADHDRLTAIDPALAERVLSITTARLRRMLPATRFAAQIDRAQIGLWFTNESDAEARAELEAIAYALSEEIDDDGYKLTPQIKIRLETADVSMECDAAAVVARAVASFSLPGGKSAPAHEPRTADDRAALARERYTLEQDLQHAVVRQELRLNYQPLIDAEQMRVSGAEALIRWDHSERGSIPPARFIPIMETVGLSSELGMWALNSAIREARNWRLAGHTDLRVAVNVSGLQLERDDLPVLIQRTLQHHGMTAEVLELELTESIATTDAVHCRKIFEALRAMGIKLAVDDFGTGYSGFSSLRQLNFDKIKIDREFITEVNSRRDSQAICQSIIALGRGLGIRVLAEGVECRAEYEWLRRHGCTHFQGFYFAKPMEGNAFSAFTRDLAHLKTLLSLDPVDTFFERLSA